MSNAYMDLNLHAVLSMLCYAHNTHQLNPSKPILLLSCKHYYFSLTWFFFGFDCSLQVIIKLFTLLSLLLR